MGENLDIYIEFLCTTSLMGLIFPCLKVLICDFLQLMPHESTVDHGAVLRTEKAAQLRREDSVGQKGRLFGPLDLEFFGFSRIYVFTILVRGWTQKTATENEFFHEEEEDGSNESSDLDDPQVSRAFSLHSIERVIQTKEKIKN